MWRLPLLQVRYEDSDEDEGPQPDATLEQGAPIPVRMHGSFPAELASTPLEDIDTYYHNQRVRQVLLPGDFFRATTGKLRVCWCPPAARGPAAVVSSPRRNSSLSCEVILDAKSREEGGGASSQTGSLGDPAIKSLCLSAPSLTRRGRSGMAALAKVEGGWTSLRSLRSLR